MNKRILSIFLMLICTSAGFAQNFGIELDGNSGGITLCNSEDYDIGDGFTIEAWIFASEWRTEAWQGSILVKDRNMPGGFAFRAGKNGTLSMVMAVDGDWFEVQSAEVMNANQWYHVATRVNGNNLALFINGQLVNSASFTGTPNHNDNAATVGASPDFPGRVWNGILDEIRVWNVARTDAEINDNQATAFAGNEVGLVSYLPMNEGSGATADNLVATGCDGNLLGGTGWNDGWSIPAIDLGVTAVRAPDVLSIFERPVKVEVDVQNFGSESAGNFPINLTINGLPTLNGTFSGSLAPGESATYIFETPLDLTGNNTNLVSARTADTEDANGLNDAASYRYRRPDDGNIVTLLNGEQHNFGAAGQTQLTPLNMPKNMEDFEQIILHIGVQCPNTGCDPWDQTANFSIITEDGEELEIARYITPYRIACDGWDVDVTDFKSQMSGNVTLKSFIQVFGQSGWLVNAELEFIKGDAPVHTQARRLWESQYIVYGEPTVSYDLEEQTNTVASNTEAAHMRLTISGHGQGNTNNAAEFSNFTHGVVVNGAWVADHNPWRNDCGSNPCANQLGTWTNSRAGWCPGQEVDPFIHDLEDDLVAGQDISIDYQLQDYTNLLNTGYNDQDHTEPHFRLAAFLVEESNTHFTSQTNLRADSTAFLIDGEPGAPTGNQLVFYIYNSGSEAVVNPLVSYYVDGELVFEEVANATIDPGTTYQHIFSQNTSLTQEDDQTVYAKVNGAGDENISDDVTGNFSVELLVAVREASELGIEIFPNPSSGIVTIAAAHDLLGGDVQILDVQGRVLQSIQINSARFELEINNAGFYLLRLRTANGQQYFSKLVIE